MGQGPGGDRIRAETKLTPLIPNLRKAKNIEFLTTPFVESALLHDDETFTHQYTVGSAIMTKLRLPPSKIGTLPRSALRLLGDASIEKVLVTEGIESLLAQRSIAPYSYAPQFPDDTPIVNVVGKTRTWPVFVTDPHANRAFAAYLKGESKLPETVDKLYGCIAAAGDASGYQLAVLRFPLELLADENSTTRLHTFFEAMQGSSASTVAIRSLGDCLSYVVANQDGAPTVDHAINLLHVPDRSVIAKYAARIDAIVEEFPRLSSERKIFAMIALDRGFEEAALGSGSHQDRIVLEAVHNALTDVVTRNRDIFDVMSSIPTNLAAPKLHQFGHAMLNRYSDVAAKYASLL